LKDFTESCAHGINTFKSNFVLLTHSQSKPIHLFLSYMDNQDIFFYTNV
jgi:hypothetical protein